MANTKNVEYVVPYASAAWFACRVPNIQTQAWMVKADIYSITERIVDTVTGQATENTLSKSSVWFDTLQTSSFIGNSNYQYNVLVPLSAATFPNPRKYTYQLIIVPDNGSGAANTNYTHKTEEITVVGD